MRSSATQSTEEAKIEGPCSTLLDAAHSWVVPNTKTHLMSPNSHDTVVNAERNYIARDALTRRCAEKRLRPEHNHVPHRTWQPPWSPHSTCLCRNTIDSSVFSQWATTTQSGSFAVVRNFLTQLRKGFSKYLRKCCQARGRRAYSFIRTCARVVGVCVES